MSTSQPDDFQVMQCLQRILQSSDLTKLTRKEVRKQLESELGGSFSSPDWKARIKQQIEEFVRNREAAVNTHSNPLPTKQDNHNIHNNGKSEYFEEQQQQSSNKRRRLNNNEYEINGNNQSQNQNSRQTENYDGRRKRPRLQSNRQLIQKNLKDDSYYLRLPGDGAKKRCIIHTYRRKLYVGFREYYEKNGEELPSKKGMSSFVYISIYPIIYLLIACKLRIFESIEIESIQKGINLTQEQWEFVVKHIDDINAQIKSMRH